MSVNPYLICLVLRALYSPFSINVYKFGIVCDICESIGLVSFRMFFMELNDCRLHRGRYYINCVKALCERTFVLFYSISVQSKIEKYRISSKHLITVKYREIQGTCLVSFTLYVQHRENGETDFVISVTGFHSIKVTSVICFDTAKKKSFSFLLIK